ncbi:hypothetical protein [Actinocrispum wychmicini]|uniref:Repeat protein (TIGR01451 family) n=1 Tax=Actinocrispum wychmicini TaxID=1213861 RepID=A0A4R2IMX6_9PSEU|nr:hypothetical protein [Actinocrispum wychmicini]TCO45892.1 hypothetical protein EV192_12078 [Actinocrispum wychmicini]
MLTRKRKAGLAGGAVLLAATLGAGGVAQAGQPGPTRPAAPVAGDVDLYLVRGGAELVPGAAVDRAMTVFNRGRDMTGNVELFYTTPFFVNIDKSKPLPAGCVMRYVNKDYYVPEVVKCTLPPLAHDARHEVSLPLVVLAGAPTTATYGAAIARPAAPDKDPERNITDNIATPGGVIATPAAPGTAKKETAGARVATQVTSGVLVDDKPSEQVYRISNLGDQAARGVRLVSVTPLYVNTSTAGSLPDGCTLQLKDPDPAVPEIADCAIGTIEPGQSRELRIPVKAVPGGPDTLKLGAVVTAVKPIGRQDGNIENANVNTVASGNAVSVGRL